jgi:hypothetical protein
MPAILAGRQAGILGKVHDMASHDDADLVELRRRLVPAFARIEERLAAMDAAQRRRRARRRRRLAGVALGCLAILGPAGTVFWQFRRPDPPVVAPTALEPVPEAGPPATVQAPAPDDATTLRGLLREWIAATNGADLPGQMTFYPPRVSAFYLARDVSRDVVLAEKRRVFDRAHVIDIRASEPDVAVAADGRSAVMRFRKRYVIQGPRIDRAGEVVQELRWVRLAEGWRIDSERDIRVLQRGRTGGSPS